MPAPEEIYCRSQQFQHFIAPFNASGVILQFRTANIRASQVYGIQEFLNAAFVFDFKGIAYLLGSKLQIPYCVTIIFE